MPSPAERRRRGAPQISAPARAWPPAPPHRRVSWSWTPTSAG